ncbi:MAG: replication-relaxation family protein [Pseudomonadota bacterium]
MGAAQKLLDLAPTEDDALIMLETFQNDIIDADALCGLLSHRADASLRVRIRKLAQAGYIEELKQPIFRRGGGSFAKRYRIANLGARHLNEVYALDIPTTRWATKNKNLTPGHILHSLRETAFLCQLRGSVAERDDIEFHFPREIYERFKPDLLKLPALPNLLQTKTSFFGHKGIEATQWDRFCQLKYLANPKGKQNRFLFVEIDMGHETINPSDATLRKQSFWRGSSLLRKWVVYAQAFQNGSHKDQLGIPTFQVLHITTNRDRVLEMIEALKTRKAKAELNFAPARFLFTDFPSLRAVSGDVLNAAIFDADGQPFRLGANYQPKTD